MSLNDAMDDLNDLLSSVMKDLIKVYKGNKSAAQRIRVGTVRLEKVGKIFRRESLLKERGSRVKKRKKLLRKKRSRASSL